MRRRRYQGSRVPAPKGTRDGQDDSPWSSTDRRLNSALHSAAMANQRHYPHGKAYYERKLAVQKGRVGALRSRKRQLSDVVSSRRATGLGTRMRG